MLSSLTGHHRRCLLMYALLQCGMQMFAYNPFVPYNLVRYLKAHFERCRHYGDGWERI